jgi:predicted short-subunit dehydrogenase-like oxidoreductase (DUF2520 family)
MKELPEIPVFIDASDEVARKKLLQLAQSISKDHVVEADDNKRLKMHVAAVMVSNFVNHLYRLAEDYCKREGIDFNELTPLIEETAQRIRNISPSKAQTGPAIRNDEPTIQQHLQLLEKYPQLKKIYEVMTNSIRDGSMD